MLPARHFYTVPAFFIVRLDFLRLRLHPNKDTHVLAFVCFDELNIGVGDPTIVRRRFFLPCTIDVGIKIARGTLVQHFCGLS